MRRSKTPPEIEYRLLIAPHFNERKQRYTTLVTLETTKAFASFRYELSVKETSEGKSIRYKIIGLKAPQLSLPSSGSAQFVKEYDALKGKYEFVVQGLDGSTNTFVVRISPPPLKLLTSPPPTFVEAMVNDTRPV